MAIRITDQRGPGWDRRANQANDNRQSCDSLQTSGWV